MKKRSFFILILLLVLTSATMLFNNSEVFAAFVAQDQLDGGGGGGTSTHTCNQSGGSFNTATCTSSGTKGYYCSVCGSKSRSSPASALGHSWGSWTTTKYATCKVKGSKKRTCSRCGGTDTEQLALNTANHDSSATLNKIILTAATYCDQQGKYSYQCSYCNGWTADEYFYGSTHRGPTAMIAHRVKTCTYGGCTDEKCLACNDIIKHWVGEVPGHEWSYNITKNATCTTNGTGSRTCAVCGAKETYNPSAYGHSMSGWKTSDTQHWKVCNNGCGREESRANHADGDNNGYCDTCNFTMYLAPSAPTITIKDAASGGNEITSAWTNKDLYIHIGGSSLSAGKGSVGYKYKLNSNAYSTYSSAVSYTSINTDTTVYAKSYNTGKTDKESSEVSKTLPKIEKTAPTFTLSMDNSNWANSHTATVTAADTGGSGLAATTYTINYEWTTSSSAPSSLSKSVTLKPSAGDSSKSVTIPGSGFNGTYYLHIKISSKVTDRAGNACSTTTRSASANFDNTVPTLSFSIDNSDYKQSHRATLTVKDTGGAGFAAADYKVEYAWTTSSSAPSSFSSSKTLSLAAGDTTKSITFDHNGVTGTYYLHIKLSAVKDRAGNACATTTGKVTGYFDNTAPTFTIAIDNSNWANSHTATITAKDTGGSNLAGATYAVKYSWTTSSTAPSSFDSSKNLAITAGDTEESITLTKNTGTGTYYLHIKIESQVADIAGNKCSTTTGKVTAYLDNTLPTFTMKVDNENWAKSHTATMNFADNATGDGGLKADTYTISYTWTQSTSTPSSYGSTKKVTITDGTKTQNETITKSDGTGLYYLHIKIDKKLTDRAGNQCATTTLYVPFYMDNTAPTMTMTVDNQNWKKSHTATVTFADNATGDGGLKGDTYTLSYTWTQSTSTPSSYAENRSVTIAAGAKTKTETITKSTGTGLHYLHIKLNKKLTDLAGNQCQTTTLYVPFYLDNTPPTFTIAVDNQNWQKSHTATVTFADNATGDGGLRADTYTMSYTWTTSSTTPSSYAHSKSVSIADGTKVHKEELTKSDETGLYYLHVKIDKKLTDRAENQASNTTLVIPFYMDNTAPVITHKPVETTPVALNSNATYTMTMLVTDKHAGIDTGVFTASDITVKVNGKTSTASKTLTYKSVSSGVYEYTLKLTNITETGPITLEIPANAVPDIAGNNSVGTNFTLTTKSGVNFVGPYADNVDPVIMMTGSVTSVKVDTGKNLSGVIDERYINKYYTIQIPFKILDVGGQDFTNVFESEDVSNVSAGSITLNPSKKIVTLNTATTTADSETNLTIYQKDYTLTLYGLLEDGYINLTVAANSLADLAGNVNVQGKFAPYTNQTGSNINIYIDNTLPQPTVRTALTAQVANGATTIDVDMFLKELGAGIREDQFEEEDMNYRIDGALVSTLTAVLTPDPGNDYNSALGSSVPTNYTYELILSNIRESGMLRIQVTENQIIDKANNGNTSVTMDVNIEIDNIGPKLGILVTNADANGEVYGEPIQVSIIGCSDTSGIAKYEWQRSLDGVNFETIYTDNSAAPDSTVIDPQTVENTYYYRVIVTDVLGNSSTSEVVSVDYRHALNTKPIITLSKEQRTAELVDIHGVIKSKAPIVKIVINGSEYPKSNWENNVITNNYEITTTFDYPVTRNGIYTVEVTDEKGNKATATINIIDFDFSESIITYTKQDVTPLTPAQIIFTSNEPVRIINPNAHPGITYDTTDFSTKIIAIVSPDVDFDESKIFDFENKGLTEVSVEVLPPLLTRFTYLRFAGPVSTNFNMNILQIGALVENLSDTKLMTSTGTIKSYYGLKNANAQIATESDINVAQKLGAAVEAYVMNDKGELVKLEKTLDSTVSSNSNYSTGNVSGAYKKTSGLLDNYSDTLLNDETIKYARFRIVLIP